MNLLMGILLGMVLTFLWLATWGTWLKRHPARPDEWDQLVRRLRADDLRNRYDGPDVQSTQDGRNT